MRILEPRKGSGGGGGSGHGGGRGGTRGRGSSQRLGQPDMSGVSQSPIELVYSGQAYIAKPFGYGDDKRRVIPKNKPFAGREVGGGTRGEVYGTSTYGSGYPGAGILSRGVANRDFPFYYWPVVFIASSHPVIDDAQYLYRTEEYGSPTNAARPGGSLNQAAFTSGNTTVRVISDNSTIGFLHSAIGQACQRATNRTFSTTPPALYEGQIPGPEQSIQYYRASTVVLALDGYNNTSIFGPEGISPVPFAEGVDSHLIMCVNMTIGRAVPLIENGGLTSLGSGSLSLFITVCAFNLISSLFS